MTYYAYPLGAELIAFAIWCLFMAGCWATFKTLIWAGPKIAAVWQSRGTVAETPDEQVDEQAEFDRCVDEALRQVDDDLLDAITAAIEADAVDTEARIAEVKRRAAEAEHFEQWRAELESRPRIRQHLRRMERWSR